MKFSINGRSAEWEAPPSLTEILDKLNLANLPVAVAVNFECIPRSAHATTFVREADQIEILSPQAGG